MNESEKKIQECSFQQIESLKSIWIEKMKQWNEKWHYYLSWMTNPTDYFSEKPYSYRFGYLDGDKPIGAVMITWIGLKPRSMMSQRINVEFIFDPDYVNKEIFNFLTPEKLVEVAKNLNVDLRTFAYFYSMLPFTEFNEKMWAAMDYPTIKKYIYEKMHCRNKQLGSVTIIIMDNPTFNEYYIDPKFKKIFKTAYEFGKIYDDYMTSANSDEIPQNLKDMIYELYSVHSDGKEYAEKVLEYLKYAKYLTMKTPREPLKQIKKKNKKEFLKAGLISKLLFKKQTDMQIMKTALFKIFPSMFTNQFRLIKFAPADESYYKENKYVLLCLMKILFDSFLTPGTLASSFFDVDPQTGKVFMYKLDKDTLSAVFNFGYHLLEYQYGNGEEDKIILALYGKMIRMAPSQSQLMTLVGGDFINRSFSHLGIGYIIGMFLLFANNIIDAYEIMFIEVLATNKANITFFTRNKIKIAGNLKNYAINPIPDPRLLDLKFDALNDPIPVDIEPNRKGCVDLLRGYLNNELYLRKGYINYEKEAKILEPLQIITYPIFAKEAKESLDIVKNRKDFLEK